jgi:hypothetical protein
LHQTSLLQTSSCNQELLPQLLVLLVRSLVRLLLVLLRLSQPRRYLFFQTSV